MALTPTVLWAVIAVMALVPCTPQRANAFRSAWIPAPPPESEPAIESTRGVRLFPMGRGYGPPSGAADVAPTDPAHESQQLELGEAGEYRRRSGRVRGERVGRSLAALDRGEQPGKPRLQHGWLAPGAAPAGSEEHVEHV